VGAGDVQHLLEGGGGDTLLDVGIEVGAFEVAPQHVAGAQLARTQFLRRLGLLER